MKTAVKIIMIAGLSAALIASCKKKEDDVTPTPSGTTTGGGSTSNMSSFFTQNGVATQTFTINASTYQLINGTQGTKLLIPPGSFVTQSNAPVSGNVTIELKEVLTKKDMILTGMVPMSGGFPLVSGGEIFVKATQGGQTLKLAGSAMVNAGVPAGSNPSYTMNEFYADNITALDTGGWTGTTDTIGVQLDTISGSNVYYYYFQIDSMNWINCDYFWSDPAPKTNVTVNAGTGYNSSNCVVFMSVNGQNSVGQLYNYSGTNYQTSNWPVGKAVTFIAIAEINGQYYSAFQNTTLVNNHVENLTLSATTLSAIQSQLSSLP